MLHRSPAPREPQFCQRIHTSEQSSRGREEIEAGLRRIGLSILRTALVILLGLCLWNAATAKAHTVEYLVVPSAASANWPTWGAQLATMSNDLVATIK